MWVAIHMAHTQKGAIEIERVLCEAGFLVKLEPVSRAVAKEERYFEIRVLEIEADEARTILLEKNLI